MGVGAMLVAGFAAWFLGTLLRLAFGEGRRLPLGRAFGLLQAMEEIANGLFQLVDALIASGKQFAKLLIFQEQLLVRRPVHANLDNDTSCQLSGIIAVSAVDGKGTLIKYKPSNCSHWPTIWETSCGNWRCPGRY